MDAPLAAFLQFLTKPKQSPAGAQDTATRARIAAAVFGSKLKPPKNGTDTSATLLTGPSGLANPLPSGSKTLLGM